MLGKPVPDFSLPGTGGNFRLKDERGKKLVLYFYPRDNTPGCTQQGSDFRALHRDFQRLGVEIYGVSRDSLESHQGFKGRTCTGERSAASSAAPSWWTRRGCWRANGAG